MIIFFCWTGKGTPRVSVRETTVPVCRYLLQRVDAINRSGKVTFLDFHRDAPDKPIHLSVVAPVIDEYKRQPIGLVVFHIDPATYLYPLINHWPVPSSTAETLLVRREDNEALFLNELRFKKDTALNLRVSLTNAVMPSVMALEKKGSSKVLITVAYPCWQPCRACPIRHGF